MDYHKKYYADVKNSVEMAAHRRKNGILILPVGCFEMHGPHACMSCDTFLAEAIACVLAETWDALILPPIHYAYPGATALFPGTIDISPEATRDYIKAVVMAILQNGFNKVVIVSLHGPNFPMLEHVLRSIFRETHQTPISYAPNYGECLKRIEAKWGQPHGEAMLMLGSLHILGHHGQWDPQCQGDTQLTGPADPFESAAKLRGNGVSFPFLFVEPNNHVGRYPGLKLDDAPAAAAILREVILATAQGLPANYETFQQDMRRALTEKPWEKL
jgi:hypothetical protein